MGYSFRRSCWHSAGPQHMCKSYLFSPSPPPGSGALGLSKNRQEGLEALASYRLFFLPFLVSLHQVPHPSVHILWSQYRCWWQRGSLFQVSRNSSRPQEVHSVLAASEQSFTSFFPGKHQELWQLWRLYESDTYCKQIRLGSQQEMPR